MTAGAWHPQQRTGAGNSGVSDNSEELSYYQQTRTNSLPCPPGSHGWGTATSDMSQCYNAPSEWWGKLIHAPQFVAQHLVTTLAAKICGRNIQN